MGLVTSCCCGCSLAQGTVGTGIFSLIRSLASVALGIVFLKAEPEDFLNEQEDKRIEKYQRMFWKSWAETVGAGLIAEGIVMLLATLFLFVGVKTKKRGYLLPWLIIMGFSFAVSIPSGIYNLVTGHMNIISLVFVLAMLSIMIYLYIVVLSFYKSLFPNAFTSTPIQYPTGAHGFNQPGYVIQLPPGGADGYTSLHADFKPTPPPSYMPAGPTPYAQAYPAQFQPPPPYSDVAAEYPERK